LIAEHAKFFDKKYYKQGEPFIGKELDVHNKIALAHFLQGENDDAVLEWEKARSLNPNHCDT